jgi:non-ribosomal peptide synthetase component F
MKFQSFLHLLACIFILVGCGSPVSPATPQIISVYSTAAAEPWLPPLYECAGTSSVLARVDDPSAAQIVLRVGEPSFLSSFAYQIDNEEILVVTHRQSPVQNLNLEGARALFSGIGDLSLQVWVYASDTDVQEVFDQFVMEGRVVTPSARLAANPQQMSDTLVNEPNTVGILPRHWKAGDSREVFSVVTVPVLALTNSEPQAVVKDLIACLQKQ